VYGRGSGMSFGPAETPQIIKNVMIANGVVFIAQWASPVVNQYGVVSPWAVWHDFELWRPFTYMWMHTPRSIFHILFNMFALWMFGSQLVLVWGEQRFFRYYMVCGVGAGVLIASYPFVPVLLGSSSISGAFLLPTLGASGAVMGVVLAYGFTWPDRTIMLIFPPVAFRAIWLIPGLFLMTAIFNPSPNISHTGHLGGVLMGWLYMRRRGHGGGVLSLGQLRNRWRRYRMRQRLRAVRYEDHSRRNRDDNDKTLH